MGFFDFLRPNKSKENRAASSTIKANEPSSPIPTITPDKELYECYDKIFDSMIKDINGLETGAGEKILHIIKGSDGGFLNMSGYYSSVWEEYFKDKTWQWCEYEEWKRTFIDIGKFPSRFPVRPSFDSNNIEKLLQKLKVSDLKELCSENQVTPAAKAKKDEIIEALKIVPGIENSPAVIEKTNQIYSKFDYELYSLLMRTISFRAKSLHDTIRAQRLGIKKFKIMHTFEEDKEFVEMALKKNPQALHPVFPSDMSMKQPVIEF